jgi:hypothetical protein
MTTTQDAFGFKYVTRDYCSPHHPVSTERWTVGSHHKLSFNDVEPYIAGYHFCRTLHDLKKWQIVAGRLIRLLRVRAPAGSTVVHKGSLVVASELIVVEELSSPHVGMSS